MPSREGSLPAGYALGLIDFVGRWNVPRDAMLRGMPFTAESLAQPTQRISHAEFRELVIRACELTREPGLGMCVGLHAQLSGHGFLGFAVMSERTLGDALRLAERYVTTRSDAVSLRLVVDGARASLFIEERIPFGDLREFTVLGLSVGLTTIARALTGNAVEAEASVTFPEPTYYRRLAHLMPGTIRFDQPAHRLVFDANALALPLVMANAESALLAREQCERELLALRDARRLSTRVRDLLPRDANEGRGFRTLEEVARKLAMSTRTLKRQLAAEGTSFREQLDELRRERAVVLLDGDATLGAIADELGFADVGGFVRAFRRWTGTTPSSVRRS